MAVMKGLQVGSCTPGDAAAGAAQAAGGAQQDEGSLAALALWRVQQPCSLRWCPSNDGSNKQPGLGERCPQADGLQYLHDMPPQQRTLQGYLAGVRRVQHAAGPAAITALHHVAALWNVEADMQ